MPPHAVWNNIVMLPSKNNDGPVMTEKITRLIRGHLIELDSTQVDAVDTKNIPKSLEGTYIGEITKQGKAVGEVLRPATRFDKFAF